MYSTNIAIANSAVVHIGKLCYDKETRRLSSNQESVYLRKKLNKVLMCMLEKPDCLVSREELIHAVWDGNSYTGPQGITHSVCKLRKILAELGEDTVSIRTYPKKGYTLVVD
jgi:DNA-binding winged helix-turn-helix (wHTH) protein